MTMPGIITENNNAGIVNSGNINSIRYNEHGYCQLCENNGRGHTSITHNIFYCRDCWELAIEEYEENNNNNDNMIYDNNNLSENEWSDSSDTESDSDDDDYDEISHYQTLALAESSDNMEYEIMVFAFEQYKREVISSNRWHTISRNNTIFYWARFLLEKWYSDDRYINLLDEANNIRNGYHNDTFHQESPNFQNCRAWFLEPYDGMPENNVNLITWINNYLTIS